jgi:S-adenosylmethionine hydrolase
VADVLHGAYEVRLRERLDPASIPAFPESVVMWTDGFGNIKTSIRRSVSQSRWREGEKVHIDIGGRRATALVTGGVFSVDEGELAWSVGSSGHDDPFMEIFLRGASASDLYGNPRAGEPITLSE